MKNFGYIKSVLDGTEYVFGQTLSKLPDKYSHTTILPEVVNQGNQNICVACSLDCYLNWYQNLTNNTPNKDNKLFIEYKDMTTSGIQIKQALSQLYHDGIISGYYKVPNFDIAKSALIINGPLIMGLPVYDSSLIRFWKKYKELEGYHAVSVTGYNSEGLIIRNSWGVSYGKNGYSTLPYEDISSVLELWTMTSKIK